MSKWIAMGLLGMSRLSLADAAPAASGFQQTVGPMIPILLMFAIFYFLLIRPQQKKQKLHQQFLQNLKKGEMVITNGGIVGTIKSISDRLVTLEVDKDVCIKLLRGQILENANSLKAAVKE